jgi:probable phosphoglycerate mutase
MPKISTSRSGSASAQGNTHALYFVRHGATELNVRGLRCGGDLDVGLTDLGRRQAHETAARLRAMNLDVGLIVSSALERTRETAAIINATLGKVPMVIEPLLNERLLGQWNRTPHAQTELLLAQHMTPPGGESEDAFMRRIATALEQLLPSLPQVPLIVSSSGVGRALNTLTGGSGRLRLASGELARFELLARPEAIRNVLQAYLTTLPDQAESTLRSLATLD